MSSIPLEEVIERLDRVVRDSPADETELVWMELLGTTVETGNGRPAAPVPSRTNVTVRVRELGRRGTYQTGAGTTGELANAVRQALGQARLRGTKDLRFRRMAEPQEAVASPDHLFDRELATFEPEAALRELSRRARPGEHACLDWTVGRVVLANSRGLAQRAVATAATLEVGGRRGAGAGRAAASARAWRGPYGLDLDAVFERARKRHSEDGPAELPSGPLAVVLSAEAAARLVAAMGSQALTTTSFREGSSFLANALEQRVFDPAVTLRDDATDAGGLPFPFDLFGFAKRPVEMVQEGVFLTPAVDETLAEILDLPPTPHAVADDEARPEHLFLAPGELDAAELLGRGELWIGDLDRLTILPGEGAFQAVAANVRLIEEGRLGRPLPDLIWRDRLPRLFAHLAGLGAETVTLAGADGFTGGTTAPAVAVAEVTGLSPLPVERAPSTRR